ncbi:GDSL esterase/lipase [Tripterygium wilfordii]|uniref:GDSL esterase/lipase n=1 Tax=Tripterygium wilfordii TaxID=458696 RepID=A0A7J7CQ99_TRIWF|nr:GDSL esterase/lipase [Tripterygium wilfordii]
MENELLIAAQLLGFGKFIPPFATAKGNEILEGVNYASGGSGIRDETGQILGERICLNAQLKNHGTTISRMTEILGNQNQTTDLLNKCLYTLDIGSNDFINNYFMPLFYDTSKRYTVEQFAHVLVEQYYQQLTTLYNYGARKISLFGVGPVGCTPFAITMFGTNGALCVDKMNAAVQLFNDQLKLLVDQLNKKLTGAKFIFIDVLAMSANISKSIPVVSGANGPAPLCCQVNQFGMCTPLTKPCPNRNMSLFWDAFHPTEAANLLTAVGSYSAINPSDVHPMDINGLSQL